MAAHACHPRAWKAGEKRLLWVQGQPKVQCVAYIFFKKEVKEGEKKTNKIRPLNILIMTMKLMVEILECIEKRWETCVETHDFRALRPETEF